MKKVINSLSNKFKYLRISEHVFLILISVIFGIILPIAVPISDFINNSFLLVFLFFGSFLGFICISYFINSKMYSLAFQTKKINISIYFLIIIIIWSIYIIGFFPALMSPDSLDQWKQAISFNINDWHPAFHTLIIWIVSRIWESPASMVIFQILFCSMVFSYTMITLERSGCSRKILIIMTILFSIFPINGFFAVTIWKDVIYGYSILWLTVILFNVFISDGSWLFSKLNKAHLIIALIFVFMTRHNGFLPSVGVLLFLTFFYYKNIKHLGIILIIFISIIITIKLPLYSLLNIKPSPKNVTYIIPIHQIGAIIASGALIDPSDKKLLTTLAPLEKWKNGYDKYSINNYLYNPSFKIDLDKIDNIGCEFFLTYIRLITSHPEVLIEHYISLNSLTWRITSPPEIKLYSVQLNVDENDMGIFINSPFPFMTELLRKFYFVISKPYYEWFTCRAAIYLYFIIFLGLFLIKKNSKKFVIIIMPVLLNTLIMFIILPANEYRYLYPTFLVFFFILGLALIGDKRNKVFDK